jgi:hypothetical protein
MAFALILVGTALIPAPVRAGEALNESAPEPERLAPVAREPSLSKRA